MIVWLKCSLCSKNCFFLTSGYFLQAPDNSNSWQLELFSIPLEGSSYGESTVIVLSIFQIDEHLEKECPNTEIECPFHIVGCTFKVWQLFEVEKYWQLILQGLWSTCASLMKNQFQHHNNNHDDDYDNWNNKLIN